MQDEPIESLCVRTIRMLAVDAIEAARSGHPGAPLGAADAAFVLWSRFLRFDPTDPDWFGRDRFVLSAGHASMLLYALLHLFGFNLSLEDIRRFRQLYSKTAGHPERGLAPGVEITTGPLGQGLAHAVGLALAGKLLQARFSAGDFSPADFRVFVLCGDGDLMEGISYEASSFAGHLQLDNLVVIYDSNSITIEGPTDLAFSDDIRARFESVGWFVTQADGHNREDVARAIDEALRQPRPSIIVAKTEIAHGAPTLHGSHHAHGAPLGQREVELMKQAQAWPTEKPFFVPEQVRAWFCSVAQKKRQERLAWDEKFRFWQKANPELACRWHEMFSRKGEKDLLGLLAPIALGARGKATRIVSGAVLQEAARHVQGLIGGSADLGPSNQTEIVGAPHIIPSLGPERFSGVNLHFGVREHAMAAIVNGLALVGPFRPYGATFLVFADYMKPALRLAALMKAPSIFVFTHDSFYVGEDGPTHQPVEQLIMLRSIPFMTVWRPANTAEVAAAWADALSRAEGPVAIVLTRQSVPPAPEPKDLSETLKGGYVLLDSAGLPDLVIIATGSEVSTAVKASDLLLERGLKTRVVSMPCIERFERQPEEYRRAVLLPGTPKVTLEAGSTIGWHRYAGVDGLTIGIDRFGLSAPAEVLAKEFSFTPEAVCEKVFSWWKDRGSSG